MAVDIGCEAIDRISYTTYNRTIILKDNPASIGGTITSIDLWAHGDCSGLIVGTFYTTNGNTLKCRDSEAIPGVITAGLKVTKVVSITVEVGDYVGFYETLGSLDYEVAGTGVWDKTGEFIDPGDEENYTSRTDRAFSLGGYIGVAATNVEIDVPLVATSGATLAPTLVLDMKPEVPLADTVNGAVIAPLLSLGATLAAPLAGTINIFDFFPTLVLDIKPAIPVADMVDAAGLTPTFVLDKILEVLLETIDIKGCPVITEAILAVPLATIDVSELAVLWAGELRILFIIPALSRDLTISSALSKALTIKSSISTALTIKDTTVER